MRFRQVGVFLLPCRDRIRHGNPLSLETCIVSHPPRTPCFVADAKHAFIMGALHRECILKPSLIDREKDAIEVLMHT